MKVNRLLPDHACLLRRQGFSLLAALLLNGLPLPAHGETPPSCTAPQTAEDWYQCGRQLLASPGGKDATASHWREAFARAEIRCETAGKYAFALGKLLYGQQPEASVLSALRQQEIDYFFSFFLEICPDPSSGNWVSKARPEVEQKQSAIRRMLGNAYHLIRFTPARNIRLWVDGVGPFRAPVQLSLNHGRHVLRAQGTLPGVQEVSSELWVSPEGPDRYEIRPLQADQPANTSSPPLEAGPVVSNSGPVAPSKLPAAYLALQCQSGSCPGELRIDGKPQPDCGLEPSRPCALEPGRHWIELHFQERFLFQQELKFLADASETLMVHVQHQYLDPPLLVTAIRCAEEVGTSEERTESWGLLIRNGSYACQAEGLIPPGMPMEWTLPSITATDQRTTYPSATSIADAQAALAWPAGLPRQGWLETLTELPGDDFLLPTLPTAELRTRPDLALTLSAGYQDLGRTTPVMQGSPTDTIKHQDDNKQTGQLQLEIRGSHLHRSGHGLMRLWAAARGAAVIPDALDRKVTTPGQVSLLESATSGYRLRYPDPLHPSSVDLSLGIVSRYSSQDWPILYYHPVETFGLRGDGQLRFGTQDRRHTLLAYATAGQFRFFNLDADALLPTGEQLNTAQFVWGGQARWRWFQRGLSASTTSLFQALAYEEQRLVRGDEFDLEQWSALTSRRLRGTLEFMTADQASRIRAALVVGLAWNNLEEVQGQALLNASLRLGTTKQRVRSLTLSFTGGWGPPAGFDGTLHSLFFGPERGAGLRLEGAVHLQTRFLLAALSGSFWRGGESFFDPAQQVRTSDELKYYPLGSNDPLLWTTQLQLALSRWLPVQPGLEIQVSTIQFPYLFHSAAAQAPLGLSHTNLRALLTISLINPPLHRAEAWTSAWGRKLPEP